MRKYTLLAAATMTMTAGAALAQDVVVMRRPIAAPKRAATPQNPTTPTPAVTPTPTPTPVPTPTPPPVAGEWVPGAWVDQQPGACNASMPQTRTVACQVAGDTVDASMCTAPRPATTQTAESVAGCTYRAGEFTAQPRAPSCSANATVTEKAPCLRSDGAAATDAACTGRGIEITRSTASPDYSTCSARWSYSAYADPGASCTGREVQTRTATCVRELDGERLADDKCAAVTREPLTREAADYSGCQPYWYPASGWGEWSSQCSASATRTREIGCFRRETECVKGSEGYWAEIGGERNECFRKVEASICQTAQNMYDAGFKPSDGTETNAVYASCSYSWKTGEFETAPDCTKARTWTRTVTCERDIDHTSADPAMCDPASRPDADKQAADYRACQGARTWTATDPALGHISGQASDGGWTGRVGAPASHIVYGPYTPYVSPGQHTALFMVKTPKDGGGPNDGTVGVDIFDSTTGAALATRHILAREYDATNTFYTFELPFTVTPDMVNHYLEFRVYHFSVMTVTVQSVGYR